MPIKAENRSRYPADWKAISHAAKERAGWRCVHPGCTARHYAFGEWDGERWLEHGHVGHELHGAFQQAKQMAADTQWSRYGDDPEAPKVLVIVLTTAHLDHDPANCAPANLAPMCQRHHLAYDHQLHQTNSYMTRRERANTMELPLE
jgi:hypothetical protein